MQKHEIAESYLSIQQGLHGDKQPRALCDQRVMVIGSDRDGNIGSTIARSLYDHASQVLEPITIDVRHPHNYHSDWQYDSLILSHGVMHLDWFEDTPNSQIHDIIDTNLIGSLYTTKHFVRETLDLPFRKRIIFIGSMAYRQVLNGSVAYCASKAGLAMATRCLAWELAAKGYDVFCIHPSNTQGTPMTEQTIQGLMRYRNLSRQEAEGYWATGNPRPEPLTPREIAELVKFLLGPDSGYLSGMNFELAGGMR